MRSSPHCLVSCRRINQYDKPCCFCALERTCTFCGETSSCRTCTATARCDRCRRLLMIARQTLGHVSCKTPSPRATRHRLGQPTASGPEVPESLDVPREQSGLYSYYTRVFFSRARGSSSWASIIIKIPSKPIPIFLACCLNASFMGRHGRKERIRLRHNNPEQANATATAAPK